MPPPIDMTFHDFNSFQRVLRARNIEGPTAVILTELYVQLLECAKQVDQCATIMNSLADTMAKFTELHAATQGKLQQFMKDLHPDYVHTEMVSEDDYKQ